MHNLFLISQQFDMFLLTLWLLRQGYLGIHLATTRWVLCPIFVLGLTGQGGAAISKAKTKLLSFDKHTDETRGPPYNYLSLQTCPLQSPKILVQCPVCLHQYIYQCKVISFWPQRWQHLFVSSTREVLGTAPSECRCYPKISRAQ